MFWNREWFLVLGHPFSIYGTGKVSFRFLFLL